MGSLANSWHNDTRMKIFNECEDGSFDFQGIKTRSFSEPPMCEDYEIKLSGSFSKTRRGARDLTNWKNHSHSTNFLRKSQCL
jgi:hypothetical protein